MPEDKTPRRPPNIKIKLSPFYRGLELLAAAIVAGMVLYVVLVWDQLPDTVPVHFSLGGTPDGYGSKDMLGAFPLVAAFMYFFLSYFGARPEMGNYPWPLTEDNIEMQYRLVRRLIVWLKLETIAIFALITWSSVNVATGQADALPSAYMTALVVAIAATIAIFLYRMYQER